MQHVNDFYDELESVATAHQCAYASAFSSDNASLQAYAEVYAQHCRINASIVLRISNMLNSACFHDAQIDNLHYLNSAEIHYIINEIENNYSQLFDESDESEDYELFLE
jgi:hypothetical protein